MTNDLSTKQAEFGNAIIDAADERRRQRKQELAMNTIESLLNTIDTQQEQVVRFTNRLNFFSRQLAAIRMGEFEITDAGNLVFRDKDLLTPPQ